MKEMGKFKFELDQEVFTPFSDIGLIEMLGFDDGKGVVRSSHRGFNSSLSSLGYGKVVVKGERQWVGLSLPKAA